jgi:polyhydroxyalkanoate synthesis regulator phasin
MAKDIAKRSRMSEKEGRKFLDDVRKKYDETQGKLETRAEKMVKDLLKRGSIATSSESSCGIFLRQLPATA